MITGKELCEKITDIYPDIGVCGIDIDVTFKDDKGAWLIDLRQKGHFLRTYLDMGDAEQCMEGKQCVSLGLQIAELVNNIKKV